MNVHPDTATHALLEAAAFDSVASAKACVDDLLAAGFVGDDISVFCSDDEVRKRFPDLHAELPGPSKTGGVLGALFGGSLGAIVGVTGLATLGGLPVVVAGGLASVLAGGVMGGLTGAMVERGLTADAADFYDQAVQDGKLLVAVAVDEDGAQRRQQRIADVRRIFADHDAERSPNAS
ncbi:MAG: hypothetical protein CMJ58_25160 [Planctomycetaceae bacterium]|nr:hypothetical protein [Planctomycetaceae bacterium]